MEYRANEQPKRFQAHGRAVLLLLAAGFLGAGIPKFVRAQVLNIPSGTTITLTGPVTASYASVSIATGGELV
ncbi:MAG TPA: hypothetical protein VN963_01035, partial [bacterium]|nr:hypothetical protein [bacterium]